MKAKKWEFPALIILVLGLGIILSGCSQMNPAENGDQESWNARVTAAVEGMENTDLPPMDLSRYDYPDAADVPPAGYQLVELGKNVPSSDFWWNWVFTFVRRSKGGQLWLNGSGIVIAPYGVPYSTWIAMTRPNQDEPWVEFEPHGLYFTSSQYARISYRDCELPEDIGPGELEIWYWNEEAGEYEYIGGYNNVQEQYIEFNIEHFSRYIVAGQP